MSHECCECVERLRGGLADMTSDRDKWQSKAHHQNQENLKLQARILELEGTPLAMSGKQ